MPPANAGGSSRRPRAGRQAVWRCSRAGTDSAAASGRQDSTSLDRLTEAMSSLQADIGRDRSDDSRPGLSEQIDAGEPHPRRRLVFAIVSLGLFMAAVDTSIVATALHPIGQSLHSTINWTAWTVTIYQLGQIMAMPLAGKISDQFGRKKVYVLAAVVFTTSSLACGLSTSIYMLVAFRLIQAMGGGAFMPSASGIVADHFGRDRDKALAMFTSIFP